MYIENKVALVTGSASGLGLVYAKELLENGAKGVTLADVNVTTGKEALAEITKIYGANKAIFVKLDVVNKTEFEDAIKKTVETFGNFDILINNAGIMNDSIWEKEVDINVKGLMNGCMLAHEEYLPKHRSHSSEPTIVNISSIAGLGNVSVVPVYCATKAAVINLSQTFALKENYETKKVRVLTVCPGVTWTSIFDERNNQSYTEFMKENPVFPEQTAEQMGASMVKIIENGTNGSIWVADGGKVKGIVLPSYPNLHVV